MSWRAVTVVVLLILGAVVLAVHALGIGDYPVSTGTVVDVFTGTNRTFDRVVVLEWRLPRIVCALALGAALGMSGAIFQALTRNPLGSPDVIGFNSGAYTGALVVIWLWGNDYYRIAGGALVGGLVVATVVSLLARKGGGVQGFRLIVIGIAVGAVVSSVNQWLIITIDLQAAITAAVWGQGTLNGVDWTQAGGAVVCVALVSVLLTALGSSFQVMQLGDDVAGILGLRTKRVRMAYFVAGVALVAIAAAAAGPISFVALAAPQVARRLTRSPGVGLTSSAAVGSVLLLGSDVLAQQVFAPTQLPVGAVTVCLGGVYLIVLLVAQVRRL